MSPIQPHRLMHAIDPLHANFVHVKRHVAQAGCQANVCPAWHGLGARADRLDPGAPASSSPAGHQIQEGGGLPSVAPSTGTAAAFDVYTLDALFATSYSGETLGLAHFDVEGMDIAVVEGTAGMLCVLATRRGAADRATKLALKRASGASRRRNGKRT